MESACGAASIDPAGVDYAALFAACPHAAAILSPDLVVLDANEAYVVLTGIEKERLIGRRLFNAFPFADGEDPRDLASVEASLARVLRERRRDDLKGQRYDIPLPSGVFVERYWDISNVPILQGDEVHCIHHSAENATDRVLGAKAAETSVREREIRLRAILNTVPDGMVVIDQRGIVESFSRTAELLFGYTAAEVIGHNIAMLMPHGDRERHDSYVRGYLDTGVPRIIGRGRAVAGQRKDGSRFNLHLSVGEVQLGDRRMFVGFVRDLTERQRTEARVGELQGELAHLSRLTTLGEMASALAHELNQPLTAIASLLRGCGHLIEAGIAGREPLLVEAIADAGDQALRAGHIIRRLRDFARRGESVRRDEDLANLVEEARDLALVGAPERGVRATFAFDPAAPAVRVDRIQVQQVVVNLVRNAVEAMEDREHRALRIATAALPDGFVAVEVADTGPGLAPGMVGRLFQPFATTKPTGMGVGLSICRTIVEAHGGSIEAHANRDGGTTFRFTLPGAHRDGA